jgi:DNA-binding transcriptional MerR regulator
MAELARLSGRPRRTIGYYVRQGLLAKPAFYGTATRYGRVHLLRLLYIERLQGDGMRALKAIKQRLDALSERELEALVAAQPLSAAVAAALGLAAPLPGGAAPARPSANGVPAGGCSTQSRSVARRNGNFRTVQAGLAKLKACRKTSARQHALATVNDLDRAVAVEVG